MADEKAQAAERQYQDKLGPYILPNELVNIFHTTLIRVHELTITIVRKNMTV